MTRSALSVDWIALFKVNKVAVECENFIDCSSRCCLLNFEYKTFQKCLVKIFLATFKVSHSVGSDSQNMARTVLCCLNC